MFGKMASLPQTPPYSNTGAQNTKRKELVSSIDWLSFTFPITVQTIEEVFDVLHLKKESFQRMPKGASGYKINHSYGNISVLSEGTAEMGIHVNMSSQGVSEFCTYSGWNIIDFISFIYDLGCTFSRLDLAIDDIQESEENLFFTPSFIMDKLLEYEMSTRFKDFGEMRGYKIKKDCIESKGNTVSLGSRHSRIYLRIYDKGREQDQKRMAKKEEPLNIPWTRTELELKDERAQATALLLTSGKTVGWIASGILRNYLRFIDPTYTKSGKLDKNKSRWNTSAFWDEYLENTSKIKLTQLKEEKTLAQKEAWMLNTVSATFATVVNVRGKEFLDRMIETGNEKMTDKHYNLMLKAIDELGLKTA